MLLTKTFSADEYARALESWRWLGVEGKTPVLTSLFGDVFLQDAAGYWFLDTLEGTLTSPGATARRCRQPSTPRRARTTSSWARSPRTAPPPA